jgi:NAD(P)-dependent dehydrogenase (short-subunit alcohol dehydrogenase family)
MHEKKTLDGKVVLVTGAGSGLGEASARAFGTAGCAIACVDINQATLERVCQTLEAEGISCLALPCDIKDANAVAQTTQKAGEWSGHLDIVINCAAIDYTCAVEEMSVEQWDQEMAVNVRGPFLFARAAFPWMKKQGSGHIFNIASTAAVRAWANASAYHASKWGLLGFSRGLSVEGRAHGIRVTTIIPGGMQTHFFDRFVEQGIPLPDPQTLQDPAAVAETMVFAAQVPARSALQELMITPINETSWP